MYLISLYFDESTNSKLEKLTDLVSKKTNNSYVQDHSIPSHLTICGCYDKIEEIEVDFASFEIDFVCAGFFKGVLCIVPSMNQSLYEVYQSVYSKLDDVKCHKQYQKDNYFPHITLCKHLTQEQLRLGLPVLQSAFAPFKGKVVRVGISKTNPFEELVSYTLKED